ncbi:HAD-IC family P-type ATPase [Salipaludibacillus daqingensis]|uniref:HAD-IC family P-type ATPase n=1 Tax=Salipaludibacillus daqingensis TaxID=3041001 RepID=UPI0024761BB3|nr:HAD-IC family P-type ATPase [Salipaludibacillus daqingensis]
MNKKWFALSTKEVLKELNSDHDQGLPVSEITDRLKEYGKNELPEKEIESTFIKFFKHFNDILIYILLAAGVIKFLLGYYIDTVVILLVAVINATIGFLQENKAEKALEGIKNMLSLEAVVIRGGKRQELQATDLVPGDIVLLNSGDKVPADIRLLSVANLGVEEAALTGESVSARKQVEALSDDTVLGDQTNMLFSGTSITSGSGKGVVVATGENTEIGKINESINEVDELKTPLMKQTDRFGKTIALLIVAASFFIYAFGFFFRDYAPAELLLSIIGLAVAAIPEGLPAIISIILALGVQNMVRRKAIVRNLPSVETLGAVSVICSDKTGTLTKNEMTVTTLLTTDKTYEVTGTGYEPEGVIQHEGEEVDAENDRQIFLLLTAVKTCNDAALQQEDDGNWTMSGEPTEGCLLTVSEKASVEIPRHDVLFKIPFDSDYKYMAVLVNMEGKTKIIVKGAPDRLFDMAEASDNFDRSAWEELMKSRTSKGERVLAAGIIDVEKTKNKIDHEDLKEGLEIVGLTGIIDPPREEAVVAVSECHRAGIGVKMITGDHLDTALAISSQIGIGDGQNGIEGREVDKMTDEELDEAVLSNDVFARTSPDNKLRLVKALQKNGNVCAMTGDGVNDAPALKRADIGVAMGIKGTEVAKESAQMILVDDNFETIVGAVEEGRRVYGNLKKTILFILPTNGAQALLIIIAILIGAAVMPVTPIQILWINMVIAITISLALAFEPLEQGAMERPPRPMKTPLLTPYYVFRIIFVSLLIGGTSFGFYGILLNENTDQAFLNSVVLHTIVILQLFHLYNVRNETGFAFNQNFFKNKIAFLVSIVLLLLQVLILYVPFMNTVFGTVPLGIEYWIIPAFLGMLIFSIIEIEKTVTRAILKSKNQI